MHKTKRLTAHDFMVICLLSCSQTIDLSIKVTTIYMALFTYQNTAIINKKPVKMITEDKLKFRLCKQIEIVANKTLEVSRYEHHVRPNNGMP